MIECEDLEDPDGYYNALGCKKIYSDEDIGVALKYTKKGFLGLGITHHPDKTEYKENIELFKNAKEQYKLQKTVLMPTPTVSSTIERGKSYLASSLLYLRSDTPTAHLPSKLQTSNSKLNGPRSFPRGKQYASRRRIWMHCKMLPISGRITATKKISPTQLLS